MLRLLGVRSVRLLTNNPAKLRALEAEGIRVTGRVPLVAPSNPANERCLCTKRESGHLLGEPEASAAAWAPSLARTTYPSASL